MTWGETPDRLRAAVMVDGRKIKRWQRDCLESNRDLIDVVVVYSCRSPMPRRPICRCRGSCRVLAA